MERCLRVTMAKEDEMRQELEKLRLNKCGKSRMNLSYKHLNEKQVVRKVQRHRLEYKHFCREFRKPLKHREVRIVNTLPRVRGFQPQDFLPILERIPRNCVYSQVLRNNLNEGISLTSSQEGGMRVGLISTNESGHDFQDDQWMRSMKL